MLTTSRYFLEKEAIVTLNTMLPPADLPPQVEQAVAKMFAELDRKMVEIDREFLGVKNGNASSGDLDAFYDEPDFLTSWLAHQAAETEERSGLHYPGVWPPPRHGGIPK